MEVDSSISRGVWTIAHSKIVPRLATLDFVVARSQTALIQSYSLRMVKAADVYRVYSVLTAVLKDYSSPGARLSDPSCAVAGWTAARPGAGDDLLRPISIFASPDPAVRSIHLLFSFSKLSSARKFYSSNMLDRSHGSLTVPAYQFCQCWMLGEVN